MSPDPLPRPLGPHDERLLQRVRPPGWRNPAPAGRYNLVVLGAGTAGLVAAAGAAGLGARVALVERGLMGGDCLNTGCVPSKALLASARAAAAARRADARGVRVTGAVQVDFPAVMERMRRLRSELAEHDSAERFRSLGVDVFLGEGRFTGPDRLEVDGVTLTFDRALVATGSRPVAPPVPGLAEAGYRTTDTLFGLTALPPRLAILGAGPVGCELAQAFARFGARVTLIEAADRVLSRDDADAAALVQGALMGDGVDLRLRSALVRVEPGPGGARCHVRPEAGAESVVEVDQIVVAAGRAATTGGIGLGVAGIGWNDHGILVDDRLRTTNPRVFAAGDVAGELRFTHLADAHARIVLENALFFGRRKASDLAVPWTIFTDPEVAHVGHTAATARAAGIAVETFTQPLSGVDRAVLDGETGGFARVHVRSGSDSIVGATVVAPQAGETIAEVTLAMATGLGLDALGRTIHCYPTRAEVLRKLADARRRTRLTPRLRGLLGIWLGWRRR